MNVIREWFERQFSNPQVVILAALLALGLTAILLTGEFLAPFFSALILAYVLEPAVVFLERMKVPRLIAVSLMFIIFMVLLLLTMFVLLPLLSRQLTQAVAEIPQMFQQAQAWVLSLPARYPETFTDAQVNQFLVSMSEELRVDSEAFLNQSIKIGVGATYALLYLAIVPFMVFFMLKDKAGMLEWCRQFLPAERGLTAAVWDETEQQIGNYVRGKAIEIAIIGIASFITFSLFGLNYALLLAVLVGLSVLIPYVGATVVTIPVLVVAYFDTDTAFWGIFIAYGVIQVLDGNLLVPLLFSEVVNIHPVAIIVAILFFGGLWGIWGVFFAIPLATLIHAVINAWPRATRVSAQAATITATRGSS